MAVQNNLSPVAGTSPTGKEARQSTRFRVLLNAELVSLTDEQPVRVRDISTGGAIGGHRLLCAHYSLGGDSLLVAGGLESSRKHRQQQRDENQD